jgi:hypothetical protein
VGKFGVPDNRGQLFEVPLCLLAQERTDMPKGRYKREAIVSKLRQIKVFVSQDENARSA